MTVLRPARNRFTSVVDRYVGNITFCLRDPNAMIRRHAMMILSQLLQEDYLKWKHSMFFRYLVTTMDDDESVRKFGRCLVVCHICAD